MSLLQTTPLIEAIRLLRWSEVVALDLETTGLDPRTDRIRLLTLADGVKSVVVDGFAEDIRPLLPHLEGHTLLIHHGAFDLAFLWHLGLRDLPTCVDTWIVEEVLTAGIPGISRGLQATVKRRLGRELPKELQASDWSGPLSADQLAYARLDAEILIPLYAAQYAALGKARLATIAELECQALPAWVWLGQSGVPFNREAWLGLEKKAQEQVEVLTEKLNKVAPMRGEPGLFGSVESWNWHSPQQVGEVFAQLGRPLSTTCDAQLALIDEPMKARLLAQTLREHRHQAQLVKMYGSNWIAQATIHSGRVFPNWRQMGTETGRTSCKGPNLQQIPRDADPTTGEAIYRACVTAPPGRVLVKADYATLQMRIAAKQARDKALLRVFAGEKADPHTATAQALLGKQEVTKADRQIAKSANFALLFGASAEGLRIYANTTFGIKFTENEAKQHRENFFRAYPGLRAWHASAERRFPKETRSTLGRRRILYPGAPNTERLNSPVQGDEADGLKQALALLWRTRDAVPSAYPVLAVHDEIVLECDETDGTKAAEWLRACMVEGMREILDPVPVQVDVKVLNSWGGVE